MADGATERERFLEEYGDLVMDDTKEQLATLPDAFLSSVLPDLAEIARLRGEAILGAIERLADVGGIGDGWTRGAARDIRSQYGLAVAEQVIDVISEMLADEGRDGDTDAQADLLDSVARHIRAMAGAMRSGSMGLLGGSGTDGWVDGVSEESVRLVMVDGMIPMGGEAGWAIDWTADGMADGERVTLDDAILSPVVSAHDLSLRGSEFLVAAHARHLLRECECSRLWDWREQLFSPMNVVSKCLGAVGLATRAEAIMSEREAQEVRRMVDEASQTAADRAEAVARALYAYAPEDDWGDDYGSFASDRETLLLLLDDERSSMIWQDDFSISRLDIDDQGRLVDFIGEETYHFPYDRFWKEVRELCLLMYLKDDLRVVSWELSHEGIDGGDPIRGVDLSGAMSLGIARIRRAMAALANRVLPVGDKEWEEIGEAYLALGPLVSKVAAWESANGGFDGYSSVPVPRDEDWDGACAAREGMLEACRARKAWLDAHPDEDGEFDFGGVSVWVPAGMRGLSLVKDLGMSKPWAEPLAGEGVATLGDLIGLSWDDLAETGNAKGQAWSELSCAFVSLGLADEAPEGDGHMPIDDLLAMLGGGEQGGPDGLDDIDIDDLI